MEPDISVGRLGQLTEVVILDPINSKMQSLVNSDLGTANLINDIVSSGKSLASSVLNAVKGETEHEEEGIENQFTVENVRHIFRVHPLCSGFPQHGPLDAFLLSPAISRFFQPMENGQKMLFCKIEKLQSSKDADSNFQNKSNRESTGGKPTQSFKEMQRSKDLSMYIRLLTVDLLPEFNEEYYSYHGDCIYLSNNLRNTLNLEIGCKVTLSDFKLKIPASKLEEVELFPYHVSKISFHSRHKNNYCP